ncbi:MAG: pyruvate formate-lyase, partial [Clostridia bacterium]|nr:pyruvate formate-lyase [Clostridia bacterium]
MTEQVKQFLNVLRSQEYKKNRIQNDGYDLTELVKKTPTELVNIVLDEDMLRRETPVILEGDIFGFNRSQVHCPHYYNEKGKRVKGTGGNLTPNYIRVIGVGFGSVLDDMKHHDSQWGDNGQRQIFYDAMRREIKAILDLSERYRAAAEEMGNTRLANALARVPWEGARNFYEACLFFKIIVYTLRCARGTHITIGRFDQYMLPYYKADIARGIRREELLETLEMLFISLNIDGDLYFGVQQGDNGQSMVLGGYDEHGNDGFNDLSKLCMEASLELSLIDPKINLRVSKKTPDWLYELGTKLTKQGLGFPQYCNDDVIVPYMKSLGYADEDAYNYTVAACWEVISPNNGNDVPNIATMNFPLVMSRAVQEHLPVCRTFEELMARVREAIGAECERLREKHPGGFGKKINYLSLYIDGCLEQGRDYTAG